MLSSSIQAGNVYFVQCYTYPIPTVRVTRDQIMPEQVVCSQDLQSQQPRSYRLADMFYVDKWLWLKSLHLPTGNTSWPSLGYLKQHFC